MARIESYFKNNFFADSKAGLTVAIMLVPQGMAYALLAGLPPIYGLYAGLVPLLIYPLFGSSKYMSVGPVAIVSILVISGLSQFAEPFSQEFIELAFLTSLLAGVIQALFSLFRLGYLVNLLSSPVLAGFVTAAALIIGISQIQYILGLNLPRATNGLQMIKDIFVNLDMVNLKALGVGLSSLLVLILAKKYWSKLPRALLVVVLALVLMYVMGWGSESVDIVGEVPSGLPSFFLPNLSWPVILQLLPLAFVISLISFIESLAIAKSLAIKKNDPDIDVDKELMGLGVSKIVGALFQAFPNTGSFTRSAINEEAGAKTNISSIMAAILVGCILLFLTPLFFYIPKAVLASIVIAAVIGLIDVSEATKLFKFHRDDFYVFALTFSLTLLLGVQVGVFAGVVLSILMILWAASKPHYAVLGKMPQPGIYRNVDRFDEATAADKVMIFRYDAALFFGNAQHFLRSILKELKLRPDTKILLLDMSSISFIDSTGWDHFGQLIKRLGSMNIELHLSSIKGPLRDKFKERNFDDSINGNNTHLSIEQAMQEIAKIKVEKVDRK